MAVGTSFKQQCPTCEAMVPIRDAGLIGKKIECPKCKDKFIVESPKGSNGKAAKPQKKRFRGEEDEDLDEIDEIDDVEEEEEEDVEEVDEDELEKLKSIGKKKDKKKQEEDEEEDEKKGKKKKKKKGDAKKMNMGLVLAAVGLVALGVAAYFMIFRGSGDTAKKPGTAAVLPPGGGPKDDPTVDPTKDPGKKDDVSDPGTRVPLTPPDARVLTNLLPPDTQHVFHVYLKDLFESSLMRAAGFDLPGPFTSSGLKEQLGFNPLNVDDLIRAEKFSPQHWVFTVVHLKEEVNLAGLTKALGLEKQERIKGRDWFLAKKSNPVFDRLARASFGVPLELQHLAELGENRQTYVHVHDRQTLVFADKEPMQDFLDADARFPLVNDEESIPTPKGTPMTPMGMMGGTPMPMSMMGGTPMTPMAMMGGTPTPMSMMGVTPLPPMPTTGMTGMMGGTPMPMAMMGGTPMTPMAMMGGTPMAMMGGGMTGTPPPPPSPPPVRRASYRTLRNSGLKAILDRMESVGEEGKEKVLFASVTDLTSAVMSPPGSEYRGKVLYRPRPVWDVTLLLDEKRPRLQTLGTGLTQKDARKFQFREELTCLTEEDAKEVRKDLTEVKSRDIVRFVDRLLGHKVEMPSTELPGTPPTPGTGPIPMPGTIPPPPPMIDPNPMTGDPTKLPPKKVDVTKSRVQVEGTGKVIEFNLDLILDPSAYKKLETVASMLVASLGAELEVANAALNRHALSLGVKKMAETGSTRTGALLPPGKYPPATFARPGSLSRVSMLPDEQVSWMAGLLPFVGQDALSRKVRFEESWRDPANWMAGRTIVPQFLDPSYPDSARFVAYEDLPVEMGATHYVGIAGVGLDAADYKPGDPASVDKRGVFGYGRQISIEEIKSGRGQSNVAVMIQVPHDSPAGVTPWIAGGGATVRGVPEKNSIAPFVLGKDRAGKFITQGDKRGTYVLMSDGSVRFVDEKVSDEVFKAMVTVQGSAPKNFDLDKNEHTPLVPPPGGKAPTAKAPPPETKKPFFPFPFPKKVAEPEKKEATPPMKDGPGPMSMRLEPRIELTLREDDRIVRT